MSEGKSSGHALPHPAGRAKVSPPTVGCVHTSTMIPDTQRELVAHR